MTLDERARALSASLREMASWSEFEPIRAEDLRFLASAARTVEELRAEVEERRYTIGNLLLNMDIEQ